MDQIGAAWDVDVAASDDLTGHTDLGGDWDLEYQTGEVETQNAFSTDLQASWYGVLNTLSFQQGDANGYAGTEDTFVDAGEPTTNKGSAVSIAVDLDDSAGDATTLGLIRFDNIFGAGTGQIPAGATITSASLTFNVTDVSDPTTTISLHQML